MSDDTSIHVRVSHLHDELLLCFTAASLFVLGLVILCFVYFLFGLVVSPSAIDCLESLVSEMTCYVSIGMFNATH